MKKKIAISIVAFALVLCCAIGGTLAWLTAESAKVTNTFTVGDIDITLDETKPEGKEAKIIPGTNIEKDPKVSVLKDSEACWLFVKVEEKNWPTVTNTDGTRKISYSVDNSVWTKGDGKDIPANVYYCEVSAADAAKGVSYYILKGDDTYKNGVVNVSGNLTKTEMEKITDKPTLTFTAYAVQSENVTTAADAWAKRNG